ncbi:hypothetical protein COW36_08730 [bacterium (Candidatus Blackallbacteria) CG17_big_fil_post_rev_8_21_14_2_50_48_46]|uniref:Uncharacterized protein n=1 Tax=bacterium (Candidatus Blackallbacteria) CG17_big_fil_post_rev_8_21_14_2_50_48_46 TaxID=2014261 RepID=A0A2M7G6B5_9BACT|nr:MAG: hypothetical protein COW64_06030 [bacterium (Candidatus Blackallbacteria) CG18_big_fil_WC_8_21_14_2_50_49_26]PIW17570.1 MAG: hypothetical protein COW36_08730 [bacterium (Candidatus Blackallbacteria) CG17_big_fil_post_rev_8_21_14_2_50_48_46]PIW48425.1 MAG: hypothetical protein COW20_10080 [bacterium (Candidatus Blackallbacteria) CG13_big_fil_rev_8_21_14_2_50_49_14]
MEFPSFPSLPKLPSLTEIKAQAAGLLENAQSYVSGETPQAEAPPAENPPPPTTEVDLKPNLQQTADFEPGSFQMPKRQEPGVVEIVQRVQRLEQPSATEDLSSISRYFESQNQLDTTDPKAFLLETAAGYADYLPVSLQKPLAQELESTYHQAVENDLSYVLDQNSGGKFSELSSEQQHRALEILASKGALDALSPEIQGAGGGTAQSGTAAGEKGHYVNSPISSFSQLIREGKLDDRLLEALEKLNTGENLDPALKSQSEELFNSALQNIAFPEKISQHSKGTCAATRVEALLAMDNPAAYLDTVRKLASPSARARIDSAFLQRVSGTETGDQSGRSVASRLIQPALMEYANGSQLDYDNQADAHQAKSSFLPSPRNGAGGLTVPETLHLIEGVFGKERIDSVHSIYTDPPETREQVLKATERMVSEGKTPLLVDLDWGDSATGGDGGHALLLSKLDSKQAYFMNPWGELDSMPRAEFDARLRAGIALKKPPTLPPRAQSTSSYSELAPERYLRKDQQDLRAFQSELGQRAESIQDPQLKAEVKAYLAKLSTQEEFMEFAPTLIDYVMVQNAGENSEVEREVLESALGS